MMNKVTQGQAAYAQASATSPTGTESAPQYIWQQGNVGYNIVPNEVPGISPPPIPSWESYGRNIQYAQKYKGDYSRFYNRVRNNRELRPRSWDYKQLGKGFEDGGNYNYGLTGIMFEIPEDVLLRGAGWASIKADPSRLTKFPGNGVPWGNSPYGDTPRDQLFIRRGISDARRLILDSIDWHLLDMI
jgi:hypothetical protein